MKDKPTLATVTLGTHLQSSQNANKMPVMMPTSSTPNPRPRPSKNSRLLTAPFKVHHRQCRFQSSSWHSPDEADCSDPSGNADDRFTPGPDSLEPRRVIPVRCHTFHSLQCDEEHHPPLQKGKHALKRVVPPGLDSDTVMET